MGNQALSPERFFAELDRLGTAVVRQRLATGAWGKAGQKAKLARLWLADNDRKTAAGKPGRPGSEPSQQPPPSTTGAGGEGSDRLAPHEAVRRSAAAAEESANLAESAYAIAKDANFRAALALAVAAASLLVHLMLVFVRPS
jgi:hypothetical protein